MIAALGARIPLEDVAVGARFLWSLPGFLRHPVTLDDARAALRRRLERREVDFLALARCAIYGRAASPYLGLLRLAGCQYGDLERLVLQEGVEGALHTLFRRGVYLTVDELKGRRPAVRGSTTVPIDPERLRGQGSAPYLLTRSSGSRGAGTTVGLDLRAIRAEAVNRALVLLEARGGGRWLHAHWGVPGGAALGLLLQLSLVGATPVRWFSQVDLGAPALHPRYRWSARVLRWGASMAGVRLPKERHVTLQDPLPIAGWMAQVLAARGTPHLYTYVSAAAHLCQAASRAGLELRGARFTLWGEPATEARLASIRRTGAEATPSYGSAESGLIAEACLAPKTSDDLHLLHDRHALIQPGSDGHQSGVLPGTLFISSLLPTARMVLLNASLGDQAVMERRACGCPLERLGWSAHLHTIRSFEKLTAGGMALLVADVIRVLEEVLPARFGGGPTDYQLVESEGEQGEPRLRLVAHPALGPLEPREVADAFLRAIGTGSAAARVVEMQWRQAGLLEVERRPPHVTGPGKILHVHRERQPPARAAPERRT